MINSTKRKTTPSAGDGTNKDFTFDFKCFTESEVAVIKTDSAGVNTTMTYITDYTVSLNKNQNDSPGGTVTMVTAPSATETITITTDVQELQGLQLKSGGKFYPKDIEDALDRNVILNQQINDEVSRSIKIPVTDSTGTSVELPTETVRANGFLGFDSYGNVEVSTVLSSGITFPPAPADKSLIRADGTSGTKFQATNILVSDTDDISGVNDITSGGDISGVNGTFSGNISGVNGTFSGNGSFTGTLSASNLSGTNTGDEVSATTTTEGVVELATQTEVDTGTDTTRVVTPSTLKNASFLGTAKVTFGSTVATTSGTSVTITDVPAAVMIVLLVINQMSTDNSSSDFDIQLGASGIETTGYTGAVLGAVVGNTPSGRTSSSSFPFFYNTAFANTDLLQGCIRLYRKASGSNVWIAEGIVGKNSSATNYMTTGTKTLTGELTQIKISTTAGSFDNGDVTPIYIEG